MRYSAYSYTNRGGREHNEDSIRLFKDDERCVCVVCDGLGGHQSGEVASALAADSLLESNPAEEAHCYVIIGGFSKNSNADNLVLKLQSQYPEMKNLGLNEKGTLYMVGAGPYTEQEAENQKEILSATYNDCWILTK